MICSSGKSLAIWFCYTLHSYKHDAQLSLAVHWSYDAMLAHSKRRATSILFMSGKYYRQCEFKDAAFVKLGTRELISYCLSRYTQRQLYAMVADVDSYYRFLPFITTSKVIKHSGPRSNETRLEDKPWLDDKGQPGDMYKLDHIMEIAAMGFDESWESHVTCEKYNTVSVCYSPLPP